MLSLQSSLFVDCQLAPTADAAPLSRRPYKMSDCVGIVTAPVMLALSAVQARGASKKAGGASPSEWPA